MLRLLISAFAAAAFCAPAKSPAPAPAPAKAPASAPAKKPAPAPSYPKPPLSVYPGSAYLAGESESYADERGAERAWAFDVKGDFKKVSDYYKKQVTANAVAESEAPDLYLAMTNGLEVRVERRPGKVRCFIAAKSIPVSGPADKGGDSEGEQNADAPPPGPGPGNGFGGGEPSGPQGPESQDQGGQGGGQDDGPWGRQSGGQANPDAGRPGPGPRDGGRP